jgi:hypothetical protein
MKHFETLSQSSQNKMRFLHFVQSVRELRSTYPRSIYFACWFHFCCQILISLSCHCLFWTSLTRRYQIFVSSLFYQCHSIKHLLKPKKYVFQLTWFHSLVLRENRKVEFFFICQFRLAQIQTAIHWHDVNWCALSFETTFNSQFQCIVSTIRSWDENSDYFFNCHTPKGFHLMKHYNDMLFNMLNKMSHFKFNLNSTWKNYSRYESYFDLNSA